MERPPLPEPVARRAHSYLQALVPPDRSGDAWDELLADVTYWGDREELLVLRLAHQVVLQHERVTREAAVAALDETGVSSPGAVAVVLDVAEDEAKVLVRRVADSLAAADRPPDVHVFDAEAGAVGARSEPHDQAPGRPADAAPPAAAGPVAEAPEPADVEARPSLRIGFDEDEALTYDEAGLPAPMDPRRWLGVVAVVVVALLLLWLLLG